MRHGLSLIYTNHMHYTCIVSVFVLSRGGGGLPDRLRYFYIIFTPPVTFFALMSPEWGACVRMVTLGWYAITPPCLTLPYPHTAWPRIRGHVYVVWKKESAWLLCGYQAGDVSNQGQI
jgi:hypothetical protein